MRVQLAIFLLAAFAPALRAQWPYVSIASPEHGETVPAGFVQLTSSAGDTDGMVVRVDYYLDDVPAGSSTQPPAFPTTVFCTPGRYAVRAIAYDDQGYLSQSNRSYFQVGGEYPVNLTRGPYLQSCTSTSIIVRWRTDWPTNSVACYGTDGTNFLCASNNTRTSEHAVRLTALAPDTRYLFSIGWGSETVDIGYPQTFRTAPTNAQPVRVWAIGDFGTGSEEQGAVRDAFLDAENRETTDLCLMLGDNAYEDGTDDDYQLGVFDMYYMLLPNLPVWPTIGNHDASLADHLGRMNYLEIFNLPTLGEAGGVASGTERYYSFDYANIHFICLDSQTSARALDSPMFNWLREDLAATERDWIVAFWHHPPYSAGTHTSETELPMVEMRERALPILESHGVDLVLTGHSHVYERSFLINGHYGRTNTFNAAMKLDGTLGRIDDRGPYRKPAGGLGADQGTVYVVCGCSGQGASSFLYGQQPCMVRNLTGNGSMVLEFDGLRLDVKFLRPDGSFADYFSIDKSQPGLLRPRLDVARSVGALQLSWPTSLPAYALEETSDLLSEWTSVAQSVTRIGRRNFVSVPLAGSNRFFRLRN